MAEALSPNRTAVQMQRAPLLSPTSPFFLGSNDDHLERARARAARTAASRRKAGPAAPSSAPSDPCLDRQQILELFQNCIKLAIENKINQKNMWELSLIDHLCDIIKVEEECDTETNFQKASCTLEAGVKIYSMRVDSVHSEAYKVLGGINRVGQESEQDSLVDDGNDSDNSGHVEIQKNKEQKLSPLSTLESSFDALNVKKFDVAFAIDPLYHQTSAQFDEGGAKGLLLNNLGVYGGCTVLFDSLEVPGQCGTQEIQQDTAEAIDVSFARESIEQMLLNMPKKDQISPTLSNILNQFDERPSDTFSCCQNTTEQIQEVCVGDDAFDDFDASEICQSWSFDHNNEANVVDKCTYGGYLENDSFMFHEPDMDGRFATVDGFLFRSLVLASNQNARAGPDHWKYRKAKGTDDSSKGNQLPLTTKKPKNKTKTAFDLDFTKALENDVTDVFSPPKNPKLLLLPANRVVCNTILPEDCHYQPEDLVKLFLMPNVMCLGRKTRKTSDESNQQTQDDGPAPSWDDEIGIGGQFDCGNECSDVEESFQLVSQPRQLNRIEVQYDKTSKQVDVQALKETFWGQIQETNQAFIQVQKEAISFRHALATFPNDSRISASFEDISPHLCFICLLHLANEHGLSICGCATLDDLSIHLPSGNDALQSTAV